MVNTHPIPLPSPPVLLCTGAGAAVEAVFAFYSLLPTPCSLHFRLHPPRAHDRHGHHRPARRHRHPHLHHNIRDAKEAVLKEDLHILRPAIDSYTVDKQKAPQSLDDLVQSGYIKVMPNDPFTNRTDTWVPAQEDTLIDLDQTESGINDVHCGSQQTAIDGTSYNTW